MKRTAWMLGVAIEILHLPFAFFVLSIGSLWIPAGLYEVIVFTTIALQIVFLGCPLIPLTVWLKHRLYPEKYYAHASLTIFLYDKFGRWWAPIFPILFLGSLYILLLTR